MRRLFDQRRAPKQLTHQEIFDDKGDLQVTRFRRALYDVNADSNPGYPLVYTARTNEEVDEILLYDLVNHTLKLWHQTSIHDFVGKSKMECFRLGLTYPAMIFVKSEGTKEQKIARLIFGVALVTNVIYRILLGDYLDDLKTSWHTAQHKVGMDMYTEDGLKRLFESVDPMFDLAAKYGLPVQSNDVQGWEYQVREWMARDWFDVYEETAQPHLGAEHDTTWLHLWECLSVADVKTLVIDSDGGVFDLPYIMLSGKPITHVQNSDMRDALADLANGFQDVACTLRPSMANGDDCLEVTHPYGHTLYERLGFVLTDVTAQTRDRLNFSSQLFTRNGEECGRVPDGLSKALYSAIRAGDNIESVVGVLNHVHNHPGYRSFCRILILAHKVARGEENAELPFEFV